MEEVVVVEVRFTVVEVVCGRVRGGGKAREQSKWQQQGRMHPLLQVQARAGGAAMERVERASLSSTGA
jgi:hypothetical protein